jgi:hypothetical protein
VTVCDFNGTELFLLETGGGGGKDFGPPLKGLSHEIDFKNFDKNLQNLAYLRDAAGF